GPFGHVPLALVGEQARRLVGREPARLGDLEGELGRQVAEPPAPVAKQVEAHDLEDALAAARVDVADVAELAEARRLDPRLLRDLTERRLLRLLPCAYQALRERPEPLRLAAGADRGDDEVAAQAPYEHPTRRELTDHASLCNKS